MVIEASIAVTIFSILTMALILFIMQLRLELFSTWSHVSYRTKIKQFKTNFIKDKKQQKEYLYN